MRTREIMVDICPGGITSELSLHLNETGIPLAFGVFDDGVGMDLTEWEDAELTITRPSGATGTIACTIDEDAVTCAVTEDLTQEEGTAIVELRLSAEGSMVVTNPVKVIVIGSPGQVTQATRKSLDDRAKLLQSQGQTAIDTLRQADERYQDAIRRANEIAGTAEKARDMYKKAEEALGKALQAINEATAKIDDIKSQAERRYNEAREALNEAMDGGAQAIARKSLDESSQNRRWLSDALKRLEALEAMTESLIKMGGDTT